MRIDKTTQLIERIGRDVFIDYYKVHTLEDTAKYFNISYNEANYIRARIKYKKSKEEKRISIDNSDCGREEFYNKRNQDSYQTKISKYGSIANYNEYQQQRRKEGCIKKYGSYKNYIDHMTNALTATVIEKYDVKNISQLDIIKDKKKNTLIENFGSLENAYRIRDEKIKKTYLKNTGYDLNWKVPEIHEKRRDNWISKYGVEFPFQSKAIQEKCNQTVLDRYGVKHSCMLPQVRYKKNIESGPNKNLRKLLEQNNISYIQEFAIDKYIYDFKVNNYLIEVNPYPTHNSSWSIYSSKKPVDKYYHQEKSLNAVNSGYICLCVWDWTNIDALIKIITSNSVKEINFTTPRKYIYNFKTKNLQLEESADTVVIYDDGGILIE